MRPPGRAELSELLERHGVHPSRALGQNFLADPNTAERIARLAGVGEGDRVLEIGAGLGSLTVALAATGARVLALETDRHLLPALSALVEPAGVEVVEGDALRIDIAQLLGDERAVLVANLPYNIATPLVLEMLVNVPTISRMLVMVQREVGERLVAEPGAASYGAVSVRVAYFATGRVVGRVPAAVFLPRPKVESVLVELVRRSEPAVPIGVASYAEIDRLVRRAFANRRKMLRRSLRGLVGDGELARAGIEPTRRPEEVGIESWGRLAACCRSSGEPVASSRPSPPDAGPRATEA